MRRIAALLIIIICVCILSCTDKPKLQSSSLSWNALADKLIERMDLQSGERVLLVAEPGKFDSLVVVLAEKIKQKKGIYLGTISTDSIQPIAWETDFTKGAPTTDSLALSNYLSTVDLGIMLPGATPFHSSYAALQEVLNRGMSRTIHFHWVGAYDLIGDEIKINDSIDLLYQEAFLHTDYAALEKLLQKFEDESQNKWIEVFSAEGTQLKFQITGRPVTKQDGDASLARSRKARNLIDREVEFPAGAIRVAPIEETVEGTVAFPPSRWGEEIVRGLVITFSKGKIISIKADEGERAVRKELEEGGEAALQFRELAIGFNPKLKPVNGYSWIPYYGYGAGIVRLSLGDNSELGGKVKGNYVRWNLFTDATVKVDSTVWIKNGELVMIN